MPGDNGEAVTDKTSLHWFFRIKLPDGDTYNIDLCTSQIASTSEDQPLACVAPLHEHLQRLPRGEEDSAPGWQGITKPLGFLRRAQEEATVQASPAEIMSNVITREDVHCLAEKFASWQLDEANQHWMKTRSTKLSKVLQLPAATFTHTFCTIVWPFELETRHFRSDATSIIVNALRYGAFHSLEAENGDS